MNTALQGAFDEITPLVDTALDRYLPRTLSRKGRLAEAMRYSVFAGGKRFRPVLAVMLCDALGGKRENVIAGAAALEMIHTYSLIHDDLPAMDNDDLRRGKPTSHKVYGEATAILAGDGLLTLAFEVAASAPAEADPARIVRELAAGAGPDGMVAGQAADIAAEGARGDLEDVEFVHRKKTGALIRAAARIGAIAARAPEGKIELAGRFGETLGLTFQIADDILDVTQTSEKLGKTAGKDAAAGKLTYPGVAGLDAARRQARALADRGVKLLEELCPTDRILPQLVYYVVERSY